MCLSACPRVLVSHQVPVLTRHLPRQKQIRENHLLREGEREKASRLQGLHTGLLRAALPPTKSVLMSSKPDRFAVERNSAEDGRLAARLGVFLSQSPPALAWKAKMHKAAL